MDGVLADIYMQLVNYEERATGKKLDLKALEGITESKAFSSYRECLMQKGFFERAPVMDGAVDALKYLNEKHRILIVSAATEYPNSLLEKQVWLAKNFPFISWRQIVFCGVKDFIRGDVMIDDHIRHLDSFSGETKILYAQPHNVGMASGSVVRADWKAPFRKSRRT